MKLSLRENEFQSVKEIFFESMRYILNEMKDDNEKRLFLNELINESLQICNLNQKIQLNNFDSTSLLNQQNIQLANISKNSNSSIVISSKAAPSATSPYRNGENKKFSNKNESKKTSFEINSFIQSILSDHDCSHYKVDSLTDKNLREIRLFIKANMNTMEPMKLFRLTKRLKELLTNTTSNTK